MCKIAVQRHISEMKKQNHIQLCKQRETKLIEVHPGKSSAQQMYKIDPLLQE